MSFERFMNTAGEVCPWSYEGWRCIHCGAIIDLTIVLNRMKANILDEGMAGAAAIGYSTDYKRKANLT